MLNSLLVLASRVRGLFFKRRLDADFDQELQSHIAMLTEEHVRRGMTPEEARRQAHLKLGEKSSNATVVAKAIEYLQLAQQNVNATSVSATPASAPSPLSTSKLIVTAPKSMLDAAAKGLSAEEFRKAVHVERITTPLPEQREQPDASKSSR